MIDLKVKSSRGWYRKDMGKRNREAIIHFFKENPGTTIKECAKKTGLSYITVWTHLKKIREENE